MNRPPLFWPGVLGATVLGLLGSADPARADTGLAGVWSGITHGPDGHPYEIGVALSRAGDQAKVHYKGLLCGGQLAALGRENGAFTYREHLTYGTDHCADGGLIRLTPSADGATLTFERTGPGRPVTATLDGVRFTVAPETCDECLDAEILDKMACAFETGAKAHGASKKADPDDPRYVACFTEATAHAKICRATFDCKAKASTKTR